MIQYVTGDATVPCVSAGMRIIAHVCNDRGGWGRGFVQAISRRWPQPEAAYREWYRTGVSEGGMGPWFALGQVHLVYVEEDLIVANMIAQHGYANKQPRKTALDYDALESCLEDLASVLDERIVLRSTIHMPRIGTGLGGGNWKYVESIINEKLFEYDVYVYDLPR